MDSSEFDDIKNEIQRNGYKVDDFQFNAKDLTQWNPNEIVKIHGSIAIKRKSTQKEKSYKTGNGTSPASDFTKDLKSGYFN